MLFIYDMFLTDTTTIYIHVCLMVLTDHTLYADILLELAKYHFWLQSHLVFVKFVTALSFSGYWISKLINTYLMIQQTIKKI